MILARVDLALDQFTEATSELDAASKRQGEATALALDEWSSHRLLLDDGFDAAAARAQRVNESLRFGICGQGYREVRIAGETRFRTNRYREAADNREGDAGLGKVVVDPAEGGFE